MLLKKILEDLRPVDNRTVQEIIDDQFIPIDDRTQQELKDDDYLSFESENEAEVNKVTIEDDFDIDDFNKKTYQPVDNRTTQEIIDDQFIPTDDRMQQELEDDDYLSFESENEIDTTSAWDNNKTTVSKPGPIYKLSTDYNKKIRAVEKIKDEYVKKRIGRREKSNKISGDWLKTAGYLDTKDQDKINYIFIPPKKEKTNNIIPDSAHFMSETDLTDFKKENLASKVRKKKIKKPYLNIKEWRPKVKDEIKDTIDVLEEISSLKPGKNAQIAAKKISEKYKKIRDAKKYKIPGEIDKIEEVETPEGKIKVPVSIEKSKKAAKKIIKKYDKIRREKKFKKIVDTAEKKRKTEKIDIADELKDASFKKNAKITAKEIAEKYKSMKRPKKKYLVDEKDLETIDYDEN